MVTKKTTETFREITVADLQVGDHFREPEATVGWQEVVSLEKIEHYQGDPEKTIVMCKTKIENISGEFPYSAFSNVKVEILN
jgi:hypothetical protein